MDPARRIAVTRLGERIRVGGLAEPAGFDDSVATVPRTLLVTSLLDLFGLQVDGRTATLWSGLRPTTPGSIPVLGATGHGNVFLNTGHGTLGWTLVAARACSPM